MEAVHLCDLRWIAADLIDQLDALLRQRFARSSPIEEQLQLAGVGKRPLPTKEECLAWAAKLGVPDAYRGNKND